MFFTHFKLLLGLEVCLPRESNICGLDSDCVLLHEGTDDAAADHSLQQA